jgi:hypothetical protein
VVHGRTQGDKIDDFGVSGYVYRDIFLIFDRRTESLWYPLDNEKWTAISGKRKGETIDFLDEPAPVRLGEWREAHPTTVVLLGPKSRFEKTDTKANGG